MSRFAKPVLLFDLDGTLIDSLADLASSVNSMLAHEGHLPLAASEVRDMIGDGAAMLVRRALASRGVTADAPHALQLFREIYDERCLDTTRPYAGIPELLERLTGAGVGTGVGTGHALAVVTNKPTPFSERIVAGVGLSRFFSAVVGPELAPEKKPSPAHVRAALALLGASPRDAVMVGDGPTDIASGRGAGCATIGVLWGYRPAAELLAEGADVLAADVPELARLLLGEP